MSGVDSTRSSARPEDLQGYRDDVLRRIGDARRSLRHVETRAASYRASCTEVPLDLPEGRTIAEPVGDLRTLAQRVAEVGEAFRLADRSPAGGLARSTDGDVARAILDRFPALANATVLGSVADEIAGEVAAGIEAAAEGGDGLADVRAQVPATLAADPAFAREVLRLVDPDHLAVVVDDLALRAGHRPGADLRWLGDLFARGAADADGSPLANVRHLLDDGYGRTAIRILRASTDLRPPAAVVEAIAHAAGVSHPSAADGTHPFLLAADGRDTGDDAILHDAARVKGLALSLLTGDPAHPDPSRIARLFSASKTASHRGLTALLLAARRDPATTAARGGLAPAGLALLHGSVAALASLPRAGIAEDPPRRALVAAVAAILADHPDLVAAHVRAPDDPDRRDEMAADLRRALAHIADDERAWSALLTSVGDHRLAAMRRGIEAGDVDAVDLAGRLDGLLAAAADVADAPDRRLDPALHGAADAGGRLLADRYGPIAGSAASTGLQAVADRLSDLLAGDPGTAGERLESGGTAHADRVLAIIDARPGAVTWAGSGVASRAELLAAMRQEGGDAVLEQWELAQSPEVHRELLRLQEAYRRGFDRGA